MPIAMTRSLALVAALVTAIAMGLPGVALANSHPVTPSSTHTDTSLSPRGDVHQYRQCAWGAQRDYRRCDFHGIKLTRKSLVRIDLRGANLRGADLSKASLMKAKLRGADLSYAKLRGADLRSADLRNTILQQADFSHAKLSTYVKNRNEKRLRRGLSNRITLPSGGTVVPNLTVPPGCTMDEDFVLDCQGADLSNCRGAGIQFANANLNGTNLSGCNLQNSNFFDAKMIGAQIKNTTMNNSASSSGTGTNFTGAITTMIRSGGIIGTPNNYPPGFGLAGGYFLGPTASLTGMTLINASVPSSVSLQGAWLIDVNVSGTNFSALSDASNSLWFHTNANGATLTGVNLSQSTFDQVELNQANFTNANLTSSKMFTVGLTGTNFSGANLSSTTFIAPVNVSVALFSANTTFTDSNLQVPSMPLNVSGCNGCTTSDGGGDDGCTGCLAINFQWNGNGDLTPPAYGFSIQCDYVSGGGNSSTRYFEIPLDTHDQSTSEPWPYNYGAANYYSYISTENSLEPQNDYECAVTANNDVGASAESFPGYIPVLE